MAALIWLFDLTLGLSLVVLAFYIVNSASVYRAVVMFLILGLLAALAWARLHAGDIALAEAAIGAGVTGALLLNTIGRLRNLERTRSVFPPGNPPADLPSNPVSSPSSNSHTKRETLS